MTLLIGEVLKAYKYARAKHKGQKRKHGTPYFDHPMAVARLLWDSGEKDPITIISAVLHDTIEDCDTTLLELNDLFGPDVATTVGCLTKTKDTTEQDYYFKISQNDRARKIKMADRVHNNSELHMVVDEVLKAKAERKTKLVKLYCYRKNCRVTSLLCSQLNTIWD